MKGITRRNAAPAVSLARIGSPVDRALRADPDRRALMLRNIIFFVVAVGVIAYAIAYAAGIGVFSDTEHAGLPEARAIGQAVLDFKRDATEEAALEVGDVFVDAEVGDGRRPR